MSKVSIAMTTYNGEKFLEQQLLSIFNQTRQPDEVIICDDGSSDRTVMIVQQFITKYNLQDSWKIIKNKYNKGLTKNFLECASMTTEILSFFLTKMMSGWQIKYSKWLHYLNIMTKSKPCLVILLV